MTKKEERVLSIGQREEKYARKSENRWLKKKWEKMWEIGANLNGPKDPSHLHTIVLK